MRQTLHTTGIAEIDTQHRRIDALIARYREARNRAEEKEYLDVITQAAKNHFLFLEHFFDVKFPGEFKQRQARILNLLADMIRQRARGEMDQEALADELHRIFLLNVVPPQRLTAGDRSGLDGRTDFFRDKT